MAPTAVILPLVGLGQMLGCATSSGRSSPLDVEVGLSLVDNRDA